MAIILQEGPKFNWKALIIVLVIVAALGGGAYALFFAPVPAIEQIIPLQLQPTLELSNIELQSDLSPVANAFSPSQTKFRIYSGEPSVGATGRTNPFIKF